MARPVCLIENRNGEELVLNEEARKILSSISQPLVVVAIVGKYRTGKSYLMNKLAGKNDGFSLGSTIQSKTKGIWMWCVPHPLKHGHTLVLLDTEGLGDVEKEDSKNDSWIFCLAVLLSSNLVFNSMGTIDQQAMEQLHYVTEITKRIRLKSNPGPDDDDSAEFKRVCPSFTWCVRDFTLTLVLNGQEVTEDEYLTNALKLKKGLSKKIQDYNLPRECILRYFHSHKCFVFDRPASKADLKHLEDLSDSQLDKDFVAQSKRFCDYMFNEGRVKTLPGGLIVTGSLLANLTDSYIKSIRSGSVPCMENAVIALSAIENTQAVEEASSKYSAYMESNTYSFPTETLDEFLNMHKVCETEALKVFLARSFKDKNQIYQKKLYELLQSKKKEFLQRNEKISYDKCQTLIKQLSWWLNRYIHVEHTYYKESGYYLFQIDRDSVISAYNRTPRKGLQSSLVLQEFEKNMKTVEMTILRTNQSLAAKDREIAAKQAQEQAAEIQRRIVETNNQRLQQCMDNQKRSYELNETMLRNKMEIEKQRMIKENEWMIRQKLQVQ
ncbi:hypothetical protein GDO86_012236 [Hymenochirus boettgeri]|uniref:GB1/RHD3-type G domain-containing protein n=1 Tax=Hymenochirus boettgeri TaxID=247094 RepID=A0A8T2ITQ0_9PIPI|nr:hypothetical protein GDO86_012236 [Hymenochirus boettgeri]